MAILIILSFILVPIAFYWLVIKAIFSLSEARRYKHSLSGNIIYVKLILIISLMFYGVVLSVFLTKNSGLKRVISIESRTEHGVIIIKHVKYPTRYKTNQASIAYPIDSPIDYLFLKCDVLQICYADALLRLAIVIFTGFFLWHFNFDQPFQWGYYKQARLIWGLILIAVILGTITNGYTSQWVPNHLNDGEANSQAYHYAGSESTIPVIMFVIMINVLFYLYSKAVRNREEIDLTI
jgi:hypothetical protein